MHDAQTMHRRKFSSQELKTFRLYVADEFQPDSYVRRTSSGVLVFKLIKPLSCHEVASWRKRP